jgi:glycosyltransferase involved in cell wall biosynthesis
MRNKKALAVDWLDKYGGAERVLTSLQNVFQFDSCYTLVNIMNENDLKKIYSEESKINIHQTILKYTGKYFRFFLILFPRFMKSLKVNGDELLIISSSHAVAKAITKTNPYQIHISYFQARNQKYIWSEYKLYFKSFSTLVYPVLKYLRKIDVKDAQKPDYIISNSHFVKDWVKKTYNRESTVIYPPVDLSIFTLNTKKENYYVAVGRIEPYKRFDIVIDAFNLLPEKKLVVIGDGSQLKGLKKKANSNIEFLGFLESAKVFDTIKNAKGFIHAGIEDFGIAPIEAQACGTPVIALGFGGVLETVINKKTGVFFYEHLASSLVNAIKDFEKIEFDHVVVRNNALKFSKERFEQQIEDFVNEKCNLKTP